MQGKEEGLAEASRVLAWNLFDQRDQLGERLYAFNIVIGRNAAQVLDDVASELGVPLNPTEQPDEGDLDIDEGDLDIEVDIDDEVGPISYQPLIRVLRDPATRDEAVEALVEASRGNIEKERGRKSGGAALKAIISANSRLSEVDLGRADKTTYNAIDRHLEQISKRSEQLRNTLTQLRAAAPSSNDNQ